MTASEAELLKLAAIVTADREDSPGDGLPLSLLSDLMDQIRCDCITFCGHDSQRQKYWFSQGLPEDDPVVRHPRTRALPAAARHRAVAQPPGPQRLRPQRHCGDPRHQPAGTGPGLRAVVPAGPPRPATTHLPGLPRPLRRAAR